MVCGIYKIVNKVNGHYYVGSSKDILGTRWPQHQRELRDRTHHNSHLTNAWHRYGMDNFEIVVVEEVPAIRGFIHCATGERFDGTRFEFIFRFGLSAGMASEMVRGKRGMVKGWAMQTAFGYGH